MGYLGGLHFWWPKMTGRMYSEFWAKSRAVIVFVGFNLTFFPQFILGYLGMPRRYHAYPPEFQVLNVMSTAGASILAVGYLLPLLYFVWSLRYGQGGGREPVGRVGPGVADALAAADRELRRDADRHGEPYDYTPMLPGGERCLSCRDGDSRRPHGHAAPPRLQHHFDTMAQQKEASTLGMWVFLRHRGAVLRRPVRRLLRSTGPGTPTRSPRPAGPGHHLGRAQHRRPDRQLVDDGAGGPGGADQREQSGRPLAHRDDDPRRGLPRREGHRVRRQVRASPRPGSALHLGKRACGTRRSRSRRACRGRGDPGGAGSRQHDHSAPTSSG